MGIISKDAAMAHLAPHHQAIYECVMEAGIALSDVKTPAPPSPRTWAGIMNDTVLDRVQARFPDGMWRTHHRDLLFLDGGDGGGLLLNFKHLNANLLPSNFPTRNDQRLRNALPGTAPTMLTVGYVFSRERQAITEVWVMQMLDTRAHWRYEILEEGGAEQLFLGTPEVIERPRRVQVKADVRARRGIDAKQ